MSRTPCGRQTKAGRPCRNAPVHNGWGCAVHLTAEERAENDDRRAEAERLWASWVYPETPICWSIPVTDADMAAVLCADEETASLMIAAWQRDLCAICGSGDALVLDHDHGTALIRGWLCRSCNTAEPHRGGVFDLYRERPPTTMLGIRARYWSPITGWAKSAPPPSDPWNEGNPLRNIGL